MESVHGQALAAGKSSEASVTETPSFPKLSRARWSE